MTLGFFFRLFYVGLIRFIGLIGLLIWYQNFEVSPLPAWTLDVFVVLVQFGWTYFCTRWVFRKLFPTSLMFKILICVFLIGQVILELWLTKRLTGNTWGATIKGAAHWGALIQIAIYSGAIYLGYWRAKKKRLAEHAADEVKVQGSV
jgi:hypothetical protein